MSTIQLCCLWYFVFHKSEKYLDIYATVGSSRNALNQKLNQCTHAYTSTLKAMCRLHYNYLSCHICFPSLVSGFKACVNSEILHSVWTICKLYVVVEFH